MEAPLTLDTQRQEQARRWARLSRRLMLLDLGLGATYLLAWLWLGWSVALRTGLQSLMESEWLLVLAFAGIFGGIYTLISLPLSFYEGYILPHRFGQSNETLKGWIVDQIKSLGLGIGLGSLILEVVYAILRAAPDTWWLWVAGFMLVFNVLLANLAPVLLFPIFYKFVPLGDEHRELVDRLVKLAERTGTHVKGVFTFDMSRRTKSANAALTGLGNTRRIILGDTLLASFTPDEIETVLAHELGHHAHKDILLGIVAESGLTLAGLSLAAVVLDWGVQFFGFSGVADPAAMPLLGLALGLYGLVTMPLTNAYMRWRERKADGFALKITTKPAAFASAMVRLANQNLAEVEPERWVEVLLYSHPALSRRIAMAQAALGAGAAEDSNPGR